MASAAYAANAGNANYANSARTANSANYANTAGYANSSGLPAWSQEVNSYVGIILNPQKYCSVVLWTNNSNNTLFAEYSGKYSSTPGFGFIYPWQQIEFSADDCESVTILSAYSG